MKRLRSYAFAAALIFPLAVFDTKLSYAAPVAGDSELEAGGRFTHSQGTDIGNFTPDVSYGYYLTPGWEVGIRQALSYNFIDGVRDQWCAMTTPFLLYNFNFGRFVLFLGLAGGIVWNDQKVTGTLGFNAGIKFFLSDQTYLEIGRAHV